MYSLSVLILQILQLTDSAKSKAELVSIVGRLFKVSRVGLEVIRKHGNWASKVLRHHEDMMTSTSIPVTDWSLRSFLHDRLQRKRRQFHDEEESYILAIHDAIRSSDETVARDVWGDEEVGAAAVWDDEEVIKATANPDEKTAEGEEMDSDDEEFEDDIEPGLNMDLDRCVAALQRGCMPMVSPAPMRKADTGEASCDAADRGVSKEAPKAGKTNWVDLTEDLSDGEDGGMAVDANAAAAATDKEDNAATVEDGAAVEKQDNSTVEHEVSNASGDEGAGGCDIEDDKATEHVVFQLGGKAA